MDLHAIHRAEPTIDAALVDQDSLEASAQAFNEALYASFSPSIVLTRSFAVLRYEEQPPENLAFLDQMRAKLDAPPLETTTPVLTLLGTCGAEAAWCDRHRSAGHKAIPLASRATVAGIPMVSRLLNELGLGLDWLDTKAPPRAVDISVVGRLSGIFYAENARSAVDDSGRHIISSQGFVADHGVETVFGNAMMLDLESFLVNVVFASTKIPRRDAAAMLALADPLGVRGSAFKSKGAIFRARRESGRDN